MTAPTIHKEYAPSNDGKDIAQKPSTGSRYVMNHGHGFNAATTEIIRTVPKSISA